MNFLFDIVRGIVFVIAKIIFPFKAKGKENLPKEGGIVLCSNHISLLDPVFILITSRRRVYFMSKSELFKNKLSGAFFRFCGAFPVNRGQGDTSALDTAKDIVADGKIFGIFIEGTRTKKEDASPGRAKSGAAVIAASSKSDILPVAVTYKHGRPRIFSRVVVRYGTPIKAEEIEISDTKPSEIKKLTTRIMGDITELWKEETECMK